MRASNISASRLDITNITERIRTIDVADILCTFNNMVGPHVQPLQLVQHTLASAH
jgi:hypothetical protein